MCIVLLEDYFFLNNIFFSFFLVSGETVNLFDEEGYSYDSQENQNGGEIKDDIYYEDTKWEDDILKEVDNSYEEETKQIRSLKEMLSGN